MKVLFLLTCFVVAVYGVSDEYISQLKSKTKEFAETCVPESGATEGDIAEIKSRKTSSTKEGKCLLSCFYQKFGFQKSDGALNMDAFMELLEPTRTDDPDFYEKVSSIASKCGLEVSQMGLSDSCEIAGKLSTCVLEEGKSIGVDDPLKIRS